MRPDAHHPPAVGTQALVCIPIALLISNDFRAPELGIPLGPRCMHWTPVPEATIYEDRDS
jgi:hypothetical protein